MKRAATIARALAAFDALELSVSTNADRDRLDAVRQGRLAVHLIVVQLARMALNAARPTRSEVEALVIEATGVDLERWQ